MICISYKDWIAGRHHLKGDAKKLQEDILSDDQFPDSIHQDEMLQYLKQQNASDKCIRVFNILFYELYRRQVLDRCRNDISYLEQCKRKVR